MLLEPLFYEFSYNRADTDRSGRAEALSHLRKGDTIVVWKLDRLRRSFKNLIEVTQDLEKKGIGMMSLQELPQQEVH